MGVIDAIADGCFAVARRPYLLIPTVALDLFYWFGGRLTIAPLVEAAVASLQATGAPDPQVVAQLRELEPGSDLFSLLSLGVNTLLTTVDGERIARPWGAGVLDPGHWALVLLAGVALGLLGLLILALYLTALAQAARGEPFDLRRIARRAPVCGLRLLGLLATILGGLLLLGLPVLILSALLVAVGVSPAPLGLLLFPPLLWLYIYLALAPEAIAVSEVGPLAALKLSVRVVRRNFWPTVGLLAATYLIVWGFPYGWQLLTAQPAGVPLAIVGNALLTTGLSAAAMLFYRDRLAALDAPATAGQGRPGQPAR